MKQVKKLPGTLIRPIVAGVTMALAANTMAGETALEALHIDNKLLSQKLAPDLIETLESGIPAKIIVQFDDSGVKSQIQAMKNSLSGQFDTLEILDTLKQELSSLKEQVLSAIPSGDITVAREYSHLPMAALQIGNPEALSALLSNPKVVRLYKNNVNQMSLTESLPPINQPLAANAGYVGGGTVAVLDSGVDYTRSAFGDCTGGSGPVCRVVVAGDFAPDDGLLDDFSDPLPRGHGTNVAGIVLGVAPGAYIAALDVFDGIGAPDYAIIDAINWAIANQPYYDIVAMNLSLGMQGLYYNTECQDNPYGPAFANARSAGILPIVAAGNEAQNGLPVPACAPGAVRVGAVYDADVGPRQWKACTDSSTALDLVTCFSNSSPMLTMLAPGAMIKAAGIEMGGTSQAAPHVAGAVAVLRSTFGSETLYQTLSRLVNGGVPVTDPANGLTHPRLDLAGAINWQP